MKAINWNEAPGKALDTRTKTFQLNMQEMAEEYRTELIETAAEQMKSWWISTAEEVFRSWNQNKVFVLVPLTMKSYPATCSSAFKNKGVQAVLDTVDFLPSQSMYLQLKIIDIDESEIERHADDKEPFHNASI